MRLLIPSMPYDSENCVNLFATRSGNGHRKTDSNEHVGFTPPPQGVVRKDEEKVKARCEHGKEAVVRDAIKLISTS